MLELFLFSRDRDSELYRALRPYMEAVRRWAARHGAVLVPLQREIDRQILEIPPERWSEDAAHPCLWAHTRTARQWLDATGL